jgi:hypothetical protein
MSGKIPDLKTALHLFLKSLPVGVKFNICSFGSRHEFLFKNGSRSYDASSLGEATRYVDTFSSDFGGTEMLHPVKETFKKRYADMDLEVFLLTDGEIWDQDALFEMINDNTAESNGAIRVFTLGIGSDVSHALIEGVARAGNGFSQSVVAEPKLLQTPFIIPPLFSFSRTTVYLLMSPETSQKTPKSVVLRATSRHGSLELEIPVTVLPGKSETIHQLAARKAVKELEEGRGWIFHAEDVKDTKDANVKLLKDKYAGRFSDMVEREAVRLGVTYQIGGKWCSFVAIEANDGKETETRSETQPPPYESEGGPGVSRLGNTWFEKAKRSAPQPSFGLRSASSTRGAGGKGGPNFRRLAPAQQSQMMQWGATNCARLQCKCSMAQVCPTG